MIAARRHIYLDTPVGRALAVVARIEALAGGRGYTYADVHRFLDSPLAAENEARWRTLTAGMVNFTLDDRRRVLGTLATRAETWGQDIEHVDIDNTEAGRSEPADAFEGLPS